MEVQEELWQRLGQKGEIALFANKSNVALVYLHLLWQFYILWWRKVMVKGEDSSLEF